ncbi:MAG: peptidoglycan DD-metalloendopeptidase family protein [SAR324 cluster bacterium]|nr:peptidoglycan DD-metalloendopeptidase family protein [SAR324 cluster bacterium]
MFKKFFTIVIVPRRTSAVKKIHIPNFVFGMSAILVIALISAWAFMVIDYFKIRNQLVDYDSIQQQHQKEKEQLNEFVIRYKTLDLHFENLSALNQKLRQMTRSRSEKKSELDREVKQKLAQTIEIAKKNGILEVIATDSSKIDSELKYEQEIRFDNLVLFFNEKTSPFTRIPSGLPVKGYLINVFGTKNDPFTGEIAPQNGIDIATRPFHPVYAPADGIAVSLQVDETYGNFLIVDHGNGFITKYGHLARFEVSQGDIVRKGKIIAQAGNTGHTTQPRLHYEVLQNGIPQNPIKYIVD